jgi:hypothetical protein
MASSSRLKPGEKGRIIARMHIKEGFRGMVSKWVKIFSNDPKRPVILLILYATIH